MRKLILLTIVALITLGAGCEVSTDGSGSPRAQTVLEENGYTEIKLTGAPWFGCGKDDSLLNSYEFTAINPAGKNVDGVVCCGWLKGCTIRF